jgi:phosphatidylserine/phosphatidylglycerophosphate/cardiolipin synthase-like enzyme
MLGLAACYRPSHERQVDMPYSPLVRVHDGNLRATALVGTTSAIIGWDIDAPKKNLLGFAIRRTDYSAADGDLVGASYLLGQKRFSGASDYGDDVASLDAPFQRFRWNDYSLRPDRWYDYEVIPMYGTPTRMRRGDAVRITVRPAPAVVDGLGIYFNRGVTSARAYLQRFGGTAPEDSTATQRWLSRGLEESLLEIVEAAQPGDDLHVAIYEFHHAPIAKAFSDAKARGVRVHLVVHSGDDAATTKNEHMLDEAGLRNDATLRTRAKLSHNKFVVHSRGGEPIRLWTGSTNFSSNAFYKQTNAAFTTTKRPILAAYLDYWHILRDDPPRSNKPDGASTRVQQLIDAQDPDLQPQLLFSPVRTTHVLDLTENLIANARSLVLLSAPFGTVTRAADALRDNRAEVVEFGLVNSTAAKSIHQLNGSNTRFFTPSRLVTWMGRSWDAKAFGAHKIHVKSLVVDPYGPSPTVVFGSANFSEPSCTGNDENTWVVRGDRRIAAVVATEFMRMYDHYKSRGFINSSGSSAQLHLAPDSSWARTAFDSTSSSHKYRDRQVFVGDE